MACLSILYLRTARPSIHHHNQPSIIIQHPTTIIRLPAPDRHQYYAQHHHDPEPQHGHGNHPADHHQHQQDHNHDRYNQKTSSRSSSHCTSREFRMEREGGWECNNLLSRGDLTPTPPPPPPPTHPPALHTHTH